MSTNLMMAVLMTMMIILLSQLAKTTTTTTREDYVQCDDMLLPRSWWNNTKQRIRPNNDERDDIDDGGQAKHNQTTRLWPLGLVYYEISPFLNRHKALIQQAMKQIQGHVSCVRFLERLHDENYVYITDGDDDTCLSYVGMKGGRQELYLGHSCLNKGNILHELMHVLGFYHEHNRADRDDYLTIHHENIVAGKEGNFVRLSTEQYAKPLAFDFDYDSIMIYGELAFSKNMLPTMTPKHEAHIVDPYEKKTLSNTDILAARYYYCF